MPQSVLNYVRTIGVRFRKPSKLAAKRNSKSYLITSMELLMELVTHFLEKISQTLSPKWKVAMMRSRRPSLKLSKNQSSLMTCNENHL